LSRRTFGIWPRARGVRADAELELLLFKLLRIQDFQLADEPSIIGPVFIFSQRRLLSTYFHRIMAIRTMLKVHAATV
jgi:hypothetical protein